MDDFVYGFLYKNESNQASKVLLSESGDVTNKSRSIGCHQDDQDDSTPDTCP
jgi:hypothetical protein